MSFRIEEKIFIKPENLFDFKFFLSSKKIKKIYHKRTIDSLYFDNVNLDMYNDSEEGSNPRKKIRVRKYQNSNDMNLYQELKISSIEGRYKTRKIIDANEFEKKKLLGLLDKQYGICFPTIFVKYEREYFFSNSVRISIDTNIEYKNFKTNNKIEDDNIIVELKAAFNKDIDKLTEEFPFQRIRFSKYCIGIRKIFNL